MTDPLIIANQEFHSRLILGTGKFASVELMREAITASRTRMVTVALRRVNLNDPDDNLMQVINPSQMVFLPNTSGAQNAEEAVRLARLARATGLTDWIKLEITPEPKYLLPDGEETLKAAKILIQEGFKVMPYINADPVLARKLEEAGTVSVMPLGSPIGSSQGLKTLEMLQIIIEEATVPVVIDAGIGTPSDAARAMELGADAVLVNTAIATSPDPVTMAECFRDTVIAARKAFLAGLTPRLDHASATSRHEWISKL